MQIRNVYGIDLGTSTVKIYDLKKDTITKEIKLLISLNTLACSINFID